MERFYLVQVLHCTLHDLRCQFKFSQTCDRISAWLNNVSLKDKDSIHVYNFKQLDQYTYTCLTPRNEHVFNVMNLYFYYSVILKRCNVLSCKH